MKDPTAGFRRQVSRLPDWEIWNMYDALERRFGPGRSHTGNDIIALLVLSDILDSRQIINAESRRRDPIKNILSRIKKRNPGVALTAHGRQIIVVP